MCHRQVCSGGCRPVVGGAVRYPQLRAGMQLPYALPWPRASASCTAQVLPLGNVAGASGRAAAAQIAGGPWAQGQEAGRARWQHTAARTAHPRQRPHAWPQRTENRYPDMRMAIYSCLMGRKWHHSQTQKVPIKTHAPHTWYAPAD